MPSVCLKSPSQVLSEWLDARGSSLLPSHRESLVVCLIPCREDGLEFRRMLRRWVGRDLPGMVSEVLRKRFAQAVEDDRATKGQ